MWACDNCGNTKKFFGHQSYTEYGREDITLDGETEDIVDYGDREASNSESDDITITECANCNITDKAKILYLNEAELDKWRKENFDQNGNFIKGATKLNPEELRFASLDKLQLLNDALLKGNLSIEEYRQKARELKVEV